MRSGVFRGVMVRVMVIIRMVIVVVLVFALRLLNVWVIWSDLDGLFF
jgi:hypothetical protein